MPFLRKRLGRAALTVVLLLTTQLAMAGQVCRAVMTGDAPNGQVAHVLVRAAEVSIAVEDSRPCCEATAIPESTCLTALGGMDRIVLASATVPLFDLAPPPCDRPMVVLDASLAPISPPTHSVGPPLRAYILFSRFLS